MGSPVLLRVAIGTPQEILWKLVPLNSPPYRFRDGGIRVMKALRLTALTLLCLLLQGCPPLGSVEFYNDSGADIMVRWADKEITVPTGGAGAVKSYAFPETMDIRIGKKSWHYFPRFPGRSYMYPGYSFGLRVESDGKVYAVQSAEALTRFRGQPSGYPLTPK